MTAEKEICLNWSRKNKELREENWSGERDRKKTDENKSIEMINHRWLAVFMNITVRYLVDLLKNLEKKFSKNNNNLYM